MKTCLTIAGSDSSGGAGIQADIKTMTALGVYAMSAITSLTAQNTCGVADIFEPPCGFLEKQLDCIFTDIFPDAVKTGMFSSAEAVKAAAGKLKEYNAKNIVVDPVMVATSGSLLSGGGAVSAMEKHLFPIADLITPNIAEAEVLSKIKISSAEDMEKSAEAIYKKYGCAVLLKGGHLADCADDYLRHSTGAIWLKGKKIANNNTHGTGCTLSSAIASYLALGEGLEQAVKKAKAYLAGAIAANLNLGKGSGPLNHAYNINKDKENS
ncbi:MAG: bifunctional hydroxymethylpyrimidine kinase/phosphomethylpyrimidine kinase [Clostridia bacterium]|nr:bifunctional hydroxymethylpyrimidine kinase/phosphomethylpyrimidine kinase [Clostridia bacterium]